MGVIVAKHRQPSEVPTPPVGKSTLFIDPADGLLKKKNSSGVVVAVGTGSGSGIKFIWNNQTEQDNEIGMALDDRGIRNDLLHRPVYEWNGIDWVEIYWMDGDADKSGYTHPDYPAIISVKDALDTILYTPISVILSGGGNYEKGQVVADVNLTWTLNKTPISQILNQGIGSILPGITNYDHIGVNLTIDTTYTITVDDGDSVDIDNTVVRFLNRAHWGVGAAGQSNNSFILGLGSSVLTNQRQRDFNFNAGAGERGYYVIPAAFGTPTFWVGGFEGGFELVAQVLHTNTFGHSELYDVWQTENDNLGDTDVTVT